MAPCTGGSPDDGSIGLPIDLTDTRQPLRRATIFVQAWPKEGREAAQLELTSFDATTADLEAKLVEAGYGKYRLRQMHYGNLEPPPARFSFVRALQPAPRKSKASGGGAAALSGPAASPSSRVPPGARPRETIKLSLPPSFDMLAKVVAPEFTTAQGIKEIIDNAIQVHPSVHPAIASTPSRKKPLSCVPYVSIYLSAKLPVLLLILSLCLICHPVARLFRSFRPNAERRLGAPDRHHN